MEKIEEQTKHRIGLTVTDPNHPMVSKRKETIQKTVRASGTKDEAINKAISHLKRKGYKVHDHHYIGTVNEEVIDEAKSTSGVYEKAQENKQSADAAKKQGNMFDHHMHMSDYHDNLAQWHSEEGRHTVSDSHAEKSEKHHEEAMKLKEETQISEAGANTKSFRAGYSKRKETKPLSPEEQAAKDKAKSDKWLEKERAKMAAKKGVAEEVKDWKSIIDIVEGYRSRGDAYQRYDSNRTGFGRRPREDDEYHTPDPTTRTHKIAFNVSKEGGEKHSRTVTISNSSKSHDEAKTAARAHLEKQGYKIHEEAEQVDEISKDLANRYMYSAFADRKKTDDEMFALRDRQDTLGHNNRNKISKRLKRSDKRTTGISRALNRITKEEVTNEAETYDYHMQRAQSAEKRGDMKAKVLHLKRAQAASNERIGIKETVFQSSARLRLADALRKEQEKREREREAEEARREKPEAKSEKKDKD